MKASSPCRPASWYIRFLSAACGDMWQTHCMHVVTVRVPRQALSRQRGLAHRVIGKTCSWLHILGAEHVGVLPKCPTSLYAAWVFWVMGLERPLIPTTPHPHPSVGDEEWAHASSDTYRASPLFVGTIWLRLLRGDIWLPEHLQDRAGRLCLAWARGNERPEVGLVHEVWTPGQGHG